ncbi:MAG: type II toxin-antitoxin system RelE/ParE family toxin [Sphingomonadaceae bacterium]|nr:type II toxin-antitoxin system RelE/ParE family toxin [Sphingomonadaceae bacterium]
MRKLRLSRAAERDLAAIFDYGADRFGDIVASRYRDGLKVALAALLDFPLAGRSRGEIRPGLRSRPYGSHVVFYTVDERSVRIVRVLHGHMQAEDWL